MLKILLVNDGIGKRVIMPDNSTYQLTGNYSYKVYVNNKCIAEGRVEGHDRITGWQGLLHDLDLAVNSKKIVDEKNNGGIR